MHVAIIMGGSGRWTARRALPRGIGRGEDVDAMRGAVEAAAGAGVATLTLYASSITDRAHPAAEPDPVIGLLTRYLFAETLRCVEQSIGIHVIGRRERMEAGLLRAIERSERLTAAGSRMQLRIVVDYSSHDRIVRAAWQADLGARLTPEDFHRSLYALDASAVTAGAVDLLICTGGERRLSDFMLWEAAYAELHFVRCPWRDFGERQFERAFRDYVDRQRHATCGGMQLAATSGM